MTYKVSKDYKRLKQLLDEGNVVVCFIDYDWMRNGNKVTDIALGRRVGCGEYMEYSISCRGIGYLSVFPAWIHGFSDEWLYRAFENDNVQFIDPDYEKNTLELEYKRYKLREEGNKQ